MIYISIGYILIFVGLMSAFHGINKELASKMSNKTGMKMELKTLKFNQGFSVVGNDEKPLNNVFTVLTFNKDTP